MTAQNGTTVDIVTDTVETLREHAWPDWDSMNRSGRRNISRSCSSTCNNDHQWKRQVGADSKIKLNFAVNRREYSERQLLVILIDHDIPRPNCVCCLCYVCWTRFCLSRGHWLSVWWFITTRLVSFLSPLRRGPHLNIGETAPTCEIIAPQKDQDRGYKQQRRNVEKDIGMILNVTTAAAQRACEIKSFLRRERYARCHLYCWIHFMFRKKARRPLQGLVADKNVVTL